MWRQGRRPAYQSPAARVVHFLPPFGPFFCHLRVEGLLQCIEVVSGELRLFPTYLLPAVTHVNLLLHPESPAGQAGAHLRDGITFRPSFGVLVRELVYLVKLSDHGLE